MKSRSFRLAVEALEDRTVPSTVAYADFNKDGLMDMAVATKPTSITVSLANPNGSFTVSEILNAPKTLPIQDIYVTDFNGDGREDIIARGYSKAAGYYQHAWAGDGDGTFGARSTQRHLWEIPSAAKSSQVQQLNAAATPLHARPFHLTESGNAVINQDGTISATASGCATHLGAFTLRDHSTIVGQDITPDGMILHVVGQATLEAANGDKLYASFTGNINMTVGKATLNFEWTGGTGRFANATGATLWHVSLNSDLSYSATANGVIVY